MANSLYSIVIQTQFSTGLIKSGGQEIIGVLNKIAAAADQASKRSAAIDAQQVKSSATAAREVEGAKLRSLRVVEQEELRLSKVRDQQRAYDLKKEEEQARRIANLQRDAAGRFVSGNAPPTIGGRSTSLGVTTGSFTEIEKQRTLAAQDAIRNQISAGTLVPPTQHLQAGTQATQAYAASQVNATATTQGMTIANFALGAAIGNIVVQALTGFVNSLKSAIVDTALYASRTEELGLALNAIAGANHIATAEIIGQEHAIEKLNITTQETRSSLSKLIIAQLDWTKATELATAAQDLAITVGQSTADELEALVRGITTMQSRVLRNAGVFTTAEEAEKKYASQIHKTVDELTTQEKQTAVLNEVLLQGARATGAYDAAMGSASKQLRSLTGRIIPEAQNAFGALLDGPLRGLITGFTFLFETIIKYPGAILVAGLAATAAATVVLVLAMGGLTAVVGSATIALTTFYDALVITALGLETTTGLLIAGTAGWAAIAAVVGVAIYAVYKFATAQKELPEVNERALVTTRQLIIAMKDDVLWFENASGAVQAHGEFIGRLEVALKRIDPLVAAGIIRLKEEKTQRIEVINKLKEQISLRERERELQTTAVVAVGTSELQKYQQQLQQLDTLTKRGQELKQQIDSLESLSQKNADLVVPSAFRGQSKEFLELLHTKLNQINKDALSLSSTLVASSPAYQANARHLADMAREAGQTAEEFLLCRSATGQLTDAERAFSQRAQEMNDDLKHQADFARTAAAAVEKYQKAIIDLKTPKLDVSQTVEGIKSRWQSLGEEFKLTFEGLAKVVDSQNWDAKTLAWGKGTDAFKETVRGLGKAFNTLDKDTANVMGGGYGEFIRSQPKLIQEALKAAAALDAQKQATKSITEQAVDAVKKQEEAEKKRATTISSLTDKLTEGIDSQKEKLAELTDGQGKGANATRDIAMWYAKLSEEQKNLINDIPTLTELYTHLTEAAAGTTVAQKHAQMISILDDVQQQYDKFSAELSHTPIKADAAGDAIASLKRKFNDAGGAAAFAASDVTTFLARIKSLEDIQAKINLEKQALLFDKTSRSIAGLEIQLQSLTSGRQQTQVERFVQSLIGIEGLNVKEDAFSGIVKAAEGIGKSEGAVQALDALVTNIVNNASGIKLGDREAAIKRITVLLRGVAYLETASGQERSRLDSDHLSAQRALEVLDDAEIRQLQRKQSLESENTDLQVRIARVQDDIANGPYNESLRIQLAFLEDIAAFRRRDEEAIIAQNKAQIEIADQAVFHAQQARAQILEQFSRDKSITQIWAEGFIGAADAVTNGISKVFDRITAKLGIFGSAIKQILTDITRLAVDRVFRSLLNAVLPGGGGQNSGGGGIGGFINNLIGGGGSNQRQASATGSNSSAGGSFNFGNPFNFGSGVGNLFNLGGWNITNSQSAQAAALQGLFTGGGFGGAGITTPASASANADIASGLSGLLGGAASGGSGVGGAAGTAGVFGAGTSGLAAMLPLLGVGLGASIGSGLGGSSGTGQALGGIGGALTGGALGLLAFTALGGTFTSPALVAALGLLGPIALIAGPALIIGAILLARNAQRRKDEKTRNTISNDTGTAIWQLIGQAQRGEVTLAEATATWHQIDTDYHSKIAGLKDKKTRRNAELQWTNDFSPLWHLVEQNAKQSDAAKAKVQAFSPTFAQGGLVPWMGSAVTSIRVRPGERIDDAAGFSWHVPGVDRGTDSVSTFATPGSAVRTRSQQSKFPSFSNGSNAPVASSSPRDVNINVASSKLAAILELIFEGMRTEEGGRITVSHMSKDARNRGTDGFLGDAVRALANVK